jgi:putative tricarboxylic transport membrane protein
MIEHYIAAFSTILLPQNILALLTGGLWGIVAGALPGISASMAVVLSIPFTFAMSPITGFTMLVSVYCGAITGGSITAVLFGIPGEPSAVCTVIEGHSLAKLGHAAHALWVFIIASAIGGIFSVFVMMAATPIIANFATRFGPPEYFALTMLGLSVVSGLSGGSVLKGLISCLFGIFLAMIGTDGITGVERFTFSTTILLGGISFVTAMVGLLAVSEIFIEAEEPFKEYKGSARYRGLKEELPTLSEYKENWKILTKSSVIGTIVGALPGAGATIASFLAYGEASRSSKHPERFGKGAIDGLMATESANNASTGGSMTTLLALGIPGSNTTAMLLGAFMIHGLQPGPLLLKQRPDVVYGIFVAMFLTNLFLVALSVVGVRVFLQLNRLPYSVFSASIMILCVVGAFGLNNSVDDLYLMFGFGLLGYYMRKFGFPIAPAVLGLVLGNLAELSLRRSLLLSLGDPLILITRPLSAIMLFFAAVSIIYPLFKRPKALKDVEM